MKSNDSVKECACWPAWNTEYFDVKIGDEEFTICESCKRKLLEFMETRIDWLEES